MSSSSVTYSCTPHYKEDADKPWVTLESQLAFSIWLSPKSSMTLEDAAKLIESFAAGQVSQQLAQTAAHRPYVHANLDYQGVVYIMTFRGRNIQRSQMTNCSVKDYMREGEPFNLIFTQTYRARVSLMALLCPLCAVCCGPKNQSDSPQAQQMEKS